MSRESCDIPAAIMAQIQRRASQDWTDDPDMINDIIDAEVEAYRELQTMEADEVSVSVLEELKESAEREHPGDYSEQREFVINGTREFLYIQRVRRKVEPIKSLLIKMENIIGNECYNASIQNYGPGGVWEGEGRSFRYPVTLMLGDEKIKRRNITFNTASEVLMTGRYMFGANELNIFRALEKVVEMLQADYGLNLEEKHQ